MCRSTRHMVRSTAVNKRLAGRSSPGRNMTPQRLTSARDAHDREQPREVNPDWNSPPVTTATSANTHTSGMLSRFCLRSPLSCVAATTTHSELAQIQKGLATRCSRHANPHLVCPKMVCPKTPSRSNRLLQVRVIHRRAHPQVSVIHWTHVSLRVTRSSDSAFRYTSVKIIAVSVYVKGDQNEVLAQDGSGDVPTLQWNGWAQ